MTTASELGFLPLLAFSFLIGAVAWEQNYIVTEPNCSTVTGFKYIDRDENGRPEWEYPEREVCYE